MPRFAAVSAAATLPELLDHMVECDDRCVFCHTAAFINGFSTLDHTTTPDVGRTYRKAPPWRELSEKDLLGVLGFLFDRLQESEFDVLNLSARTAVPPEFSCSLSSTLVVWKILTTFL